jgi:chemotaxis protein CheD
VYRNGNDIHLSPSELHWGSAPERIHTVLGSCIAITVWLPEKKSGGMCHFMLPGTGTDDEPRSARYCQDSVFLLNDLMLRNGGVPQQAVVKIIGGAVMFDPGHSENTVSDYNIECAEHELAALGFSVVARQTGGCASVMSF